MKAKGLHVYLRYSPATAERYPWHIVNYKTNAVLRRFSTKNRAFYYAHQRGMIVHAKAFEEFFNRSFRF